MPKIFAPITIQPVIFNLEGKKPTVTSYKDLSFFASSRLYFTLIVIAFGILGTTLPVIAQTAAENDIRTKPGLTNTVWTNGTTNWEICNNASGCDVTVGAGLGGWTDVAAASVTGAAGVTIYIRRSMASRTTAFTLNGSMIISSGQTFTISNPNGSNDFIVSGTGSLTNNGTITLLNATVSSNKTTLTVDGAITNNGTINNINSNGVLNFNTSINNSGTINSTNTNGGELNFSGGITQTISGGTINCANVQIVNASTIINNSSMVVSGVFAMDGSGNVFDADGTGSGSLTLRSTGDNSSVDGAIATLLDLDTDGTPEDIITGNVTVQRYISQNSNRIYRYLSFPVAGATVSQLQDDFAVTGNFTGASTTDPSGAEPCGQAIDPAAASLFTYQPASNEYVAYPTNGNGGAGATLATKTGYVVFIRNCTTPITVDVSGQVNQGDQVFTIPFGGVFSDEDPNSYSLVGNPYPSPIDWGLMGSSAFDYLGASAISTIIQIPDNTSGTLTMLPLDANDGPGVGYVATGQAFWVSTTSATSFTMTEDIKVAGTATSYFRKKTGKKGTKGSLVIELSNGDKSDKAYVKLNAAAHGSFERNDGPKLENDLFDISTLTTDNVSVVVNAVDTLEHGTIIPIKTKDLANGTYSLSFTLNDVFGDYYEVTLVDTYLEKTSPITAPYSFTVGSDDASKGLNRFQLRIGKKNIVTDAEDVMASVRSFPNPVDSKYQLELPLEFEGLNTLPVLNNVGARVGTLGLQRSGNVLKGEFDFSSLPSGLYIIRIFAKTKSINLKVVKK